MQNPSGQVRSATLAVLAAIVVSAGASAQTPLAAPIRIDNFAKVSESNIRGAQPMGADYTDLARLGVKTVINLVGDSDLDTSEQSSVEQQGMRYVAIPMSTRKAPTAVQLQEFLTVVNDPASQPVYVHCVGGRHRTGVMTAVYRMTQHEWTGDRAFKEMKQFKFGADFLHPEFKTFVLGYRVPAPALAPEAVSVSTD
jgi:protein tyrosine/serine phosphatase